MIEVTRVNRAKVYYELTSHPCSTNCVIITNASVNLRNELQTNLVEISKEQSNYITRLPDLVTDSMG